MPYHLYIGVEGRIHMCGGLRRLGHCLGCDRPAAERTAAALRSACLSAQQGACRRFLLCAAKPSGAVAALKTLYTTAVEQRAGWLRLGKQAATKRPIWHRWPALCLGAGAAAVAAAASVCAGAAGASPAAIVRI